MRPSHDRRFGMGARPASAGAVWLVLGIAAALMLVCGALFGTWHDEEYTLATTAHGPIYAFHRAIDFEIQAPLYFVLLACIRLVAHGVFAARIVSIACALGAAFVMAGVAKRIAPDRPAWPLVALVAFNPFTIYAALEIRLYAFALLLSALCWLAFYDGFFADEKPRARYAFVALALASLYTQYFLAFELASFAVALIVVGRFRALRDYVLAGIAVAIGFIPMLLVLHAQVDSAFAVADERLPSRLAVFIHPIVDFVVPTGYKIFGHGIDTIVEIVCVLVIVIATFVGRPRVDRRLLAFVATVAVVEAIYAILADVLRYQLVVPRHFIALFVPDVVAAYAIVTSFRAPRATMLAITIACVVAFSSVASNAWTYRAFAKLGDWPRVGAYLTAVTRPGDVIAVTEADALPAFERYYHGPARVVPFPRALPPDRYDVDAMLVHSVADAEAALARLPKTNRTWLVIYGACNRRDQLGCRELDAAIAAKERIVEEHFFFINRVLRIEPKSAPR